MKMRIKDGLPVEETAIVSEEDKAECGAHPRRWRTRL
jgi:hypothetical protein